MTQPLPPTPMPEPPDGVAMYWPENAETEEAAWVIVRDDATAAKFDQADGERWFTADAGKPVRSWVQVLADANADGADPTEAVWLRRADDPAVAVLPEEPYADRYGDPVVKTDVRASTYRYGAGEPDAGLQLTMTDQHIERAVCVRLPGPVAEQFLLSALAALRAARRIAQGGEPS